jgi:hypothetical protein
MQEIIIILVAISLIDVWVWDVIMPFCSKKFKPYSFLESIRWTLNHKPINCEVCLSFWTGLILSIEFNNIIFLALPLLIKFKERLL